MLMIYLPFFMVEAYDLPIKTAEEVVFLFFKIMV